MSNKLTEKQLRGCKSAQCTSKPNDLKCMLLLQSKLIDVFDINGTWQGSVAEGFKLDVTASKLKGTYALRPFQSRISIECDGERRGLPKYCDYDEVCTTLRTLS